MTYKVSIYRDDSTNASSVYEYENVKEVFMTANNTILTIAKYKDNGDHYYINWPRERFCMYVIDREEPSNDELHQKNKPK